MAKQTFAQLQAVHEFVPHVIARNAGTSLQVVDAMLDDKPVYLAQAKRVLAAVSEYSGLVYTLDNVEVKLMEASREH